MSTVNVKLIKNQDRLLDLVRYCRGKLHQEALITDEEYADLVNVGSSSARRLETYDGLMGQVREGHAEIKRLQNMVKDRDKLIACYRTGKTPSSVLLDRIREEKLVLEEVA